LVNTKLHQTDPFSGCYIKLYFPHQGYSVSIYQSRTPGDQTKPGYLSQCTGVQYHNAVAIHSEFNAYNCYRN